MPFFKVNFEPAFNDFTVYISDFSEFREFNTVFRKMFPTTPPTRATVQVARLAMDAKIEISAIAMK